MSLSKSKTRSRSRKYKINDKNMKMNANNVGGLRAASILIVKKSIPMDQSTQPDKRNLKNLFKHKILIKMISNTLAN